MTPVELLAELEARGVRLEPTPRGTLAVEPVDLVAPDELEALRVAKPEMLAYLRAREQERLDESMDDLREDYEDRAAIMEHDGRLARPEAEERARRLFPWPTTLGDAPRTLGPLMSCTRCPSDGHPATRTTWVRFGDRALCLRHALEAEALERRPS